MKQGKLRKMLFEKGITQTRLAEIIGSNKWTLSMKMNGKTDFTFTEVKKICDCLEIANPLDVFEAKTERVE